MSIEEVEERTFDPNPNYKINAGKRQIERARKLPFKVMWYWNGSSALYTANLRPCNGRLFKTEAAAVAFAYKSLMSGKAAAVLVYRWDFDKDEWVKNEA